MMKLDDLKQVLKEHKGTGEWREVARRAGVSYDTVVRIARGDIDSPRMKTFEALVNALEDEREKAAA